MKISVKIRRTFDNAGALKAVASVTLDDMFAVHNIKVIETSKGRFMTMPEEVYKDKDGKEARRDIFHPISSDARAELESAVISAYENELAKAAAEVTKNN